MFNIKADEDKKRNQVSVKFTDEEFERLKEYAETYELSMAYVIRQAVKDVIY